MRHNESIGNIVQNSSLITRLSLTYKISTLCAVWRVLVLQKSFPTLFSILFYLKPKWSSMMDTSETKIFSRDVICFLKGITLWYLDYIVHHDLLLCSCDTRWKLQYVENSVPKFCLTVALQIADILYVSD